MSFITSIIHNNTPYEINTDAIVLNENGGQVPARILGFAQAPNGLLQALCRVWEPSALRTPHNHGPTYHEYDQRSVALKSEQVIVPLISFVRPVEVLHYLAYRKQVDWRWKDEIFFFAYIYGADNKARRASKNALPSPRGRAAHTRIMGTMVRNAIAGNMRHRGANKGKTTLIFPFSREEALAILRAKLGPPTAINASGVTYTITNPNQLDPLCRFGWDVCVFYTTDNWYNAATSLVIKLPISGRVTVQIKFALMRRVYGVTHRQHTLQYWH